MQLTAQFSVQRRHSSAAVTQVAMYSGIVDDVLKARYGLAVCPGRTDGPDRQPGRSGSTFYSQTSGPSVRCW